MPLMTIISFMFLGSAFVSLWIKRKSKIWGTFICLCLLSGWIAGNVTWMGLLFIILFALLWVIYVQKPSQKILFTVLFLFSMGFKLRLFPGYFPLFITPKFAIGIENSLIGLFPLALVVPLSKNFREWKVVVKYLFLGCAGIIALAFLAVQTKAIRWDCKIPSYMGIRILSNLILTSTPEEGFYRGFVQGSLCEYFKNMRMGKVLALIVSSVLFSVTHIFWSPNLGILAFTFIASLLYGVIYLSSKKIESAIFCHFLLNLVHMTCFSYHAM